MGIGVDALVVFDTSKRTAEAYVAHLGFAHLANDGDPDEDIVADEDEVGEGAGVEVFNIESDENDDHEEANAQELVYTHGCVLSDAERSLLDVVLTNNDGIRENLNLLGEEKRKMEEELRFFKHDFSRLVADKEESINQLGSARLAISDVKEEIEKKRLADHSSSSLHQVLRVKAEKERDQLVLERGQMKEQKKKLECIIADMMKQNNGYKDKVKKFKEICDKF
ncbi:putative CBL-interacting protein kinase 13 [Hordeum vulgare]|nr:putative CBL-interacting protein kinase 13 [Hordeum vulgare]